MSEKTKHVKLDVIIGNPPYQEETKNTSDNPIYSDFMNGSYDIGSKVVLITPARFLFNAGKTPKKWNKKMLSSTHLKVMNYFANSADVFPNNDIKGGIAVTYFDKDKKSSPIGLFTPFNELNSIAKKVLSHADFKSLMEIIYSNESYKFTKQLHIDFPNAKNKLSKGHMYSITSNIFDKLPEVFLDKSKNTSDYIGIYGRSNNVRVTKYILKKYVQDFTNLHSYKVFVPKANGSGALGEVSSTPLIGTPLVATPLMGHTQTFISIGNFNNQQEAENCLKYIKSKFARVMLGILKVTQANSKSTWKYVPLQNFASSSDIDWSKSVHEIDLQLYKKYNLTQKEIDFIEKHVKAMD